MIIPGGDYTFMRNAVPITDSQPNVPSAMFLATDDEQKAKAAYIDAIRTVEEMTNMNYRKQFRHCEAKSDETEKRGALARLTYACVKALECSSPDILTGLWCSLWNWTSSLFYRPQGIHALQHRT